MTTERARGSIGLVSFSALAACVCLTGMAFAQGAPEPTWVKTLDPGGLDLGEGAAIDASGNVFVTGIADVSGQQDIVTAKLAPDGSVLWTRALDHGPADRGEDVAVASDQGVIVVGTAGGLGGDDAIVVKYSAEGDPVWTTTFDKGTSETGRAVAVDHAGNVFVAGASLSMNGGDGFLAKLSPDGTEIWSRAINLFYFEEAFDVDAGEDGGAVVVGRALRESDFDVLVRRYTADGDVDWTQFVRSTAREEGRGVAAAAGGGAYVVGTRQVTYGDETQGDVLVSRLAGDGAIVWTRAIDVAGGEDAGRDVALDASGNLLVTGFAATDGAKDAVLLKLNADGGEIWRAIEPDAGITGTGAVAIGPGGRILIAGAKQQDGADFAYVLLAYDEPPPAAAFLARVGAAPTTYHFEDASAPGAATLVAWEWDFGDGGASTQQNPSHSFVWGGRHDVALTVVDAVGNRATSVSPLDVAGPPKPSVASDPGALPGAVNEPEPGVDGAPTTPDETSTPGPALALVALAVAGAALARRTRGR